MMQPQKHLSPVARLFALSTIAVSILVLFQLPIAGAQDNDGASCSTTQASARPIQLGETVAGAQKGEPRCIYSLVVPAAAGTLTVDFDVAGRGVAIVCAGQGTIEGDDFCGTSQSDSCWQVGGGILRCDLAPAANIRADFWIAVTDYWAIGPDPFTLVAVFVAGTSSSSQVATDAPGTSQASPGDWPIVGGTPSRTGSLEDPHGDGGVAWQFETGGQVESSPVVSGNILYIGSLDGNLYALNAETGRELWRFNTEGEIWRTPALSNGVIYVTSEVREVSRSATLWAVDATSGSEKWRHTTGLLWASSPVISQGVVYVMQNGTLLALEAASGIEKWQFRGPYDPPYDAVSSPPTVATGTVFVGGTYWFCAVDAATGQQDWCVRTREMIFSSPVIAENLVFIGASDSLFALDSQTGVERWRMDYPHQRTSSDDYSPTMGGGLVFAASSGDLYAVDAVTGKLVWSLLGAYPGEGSGFRAPAFVSGTLFVPTIGDTSLLAVDAATATELWRLKVGDQVNSAPSVVDGTVYFGSADHRIYAVDADGPIRSTSTRPSAPRESTTGTGYFFIHGICSLGEMWTQPGANGYPVWDALTNEGAGGRKPNMAPTYGPVDASQTPAQVARLLQVRLDQFMDGGGRGGSPLERVVLIGHSNGGLMARLLLESETAAGRGDRIERVVTLDSPDRGADQSHFSYNLIQSHLRAVGGELFGAPPCTTPWAEWSRAFEDQNTGDTSWIDDLPAPEASGGRLIRFLFGDCRSGIGAVENQKGTAFTERLAGPTCRNGNQIVNSNAANPSGALLLSPARASASDDEAAVRDACLTSQRGIGAVALNVDDPGAYTGFSNMIDVHSEGVRYFADYIVPTVQSGLVGFYGVQGTHDCSVLSKFPEGTVAGAAAFLTADTGSTIIGQANPYLDEFTMATSVSGDTLVLDVFSPQEEGKIVVVNAEAAIWPTKDLADLSVSIDGHPLKRAGTVAELQEQVAAQADQGMYFADRIDPTSLQFLVYVPSFSGHTIEIGPLGDQPILTSIGIAVLAVAVLSIGLIAYAIGRRQGRKGA